MSKPIIGIMGPGQASKESLKLAQELGEAIATEGWVLLTGGRSMGVMDAASRGAKTKGGLVVGVLPTSNTEGMSGWVDIPILTGMGSSRNQINVLSSRVIVAIGMGAGTSSEISLAIKADRPVILLAAEQADADFFFRLGNVQQANTAQEAVVMIKALI